MRTGSGRRCTKYDIERFPTTCGRTKSHWNERGRVDIELHD